jgi:LacI family transcriptional regulator
VLQVVRDLEYVPVGQPMTQSRHVETRTLGLIFDDTPFEGLWGLPTFLGLRESALHHSYDLLTLLRVAPDWMLDQEELQFLDRRNDGFIFIAPQNRFQIMETLVRHQLPVVACYTADVPPQVPCVVIDNAGAMKLAVRHLAEQGHTRILHATTLLHRSDFRARKCGYEDAMKELGLEPASACISISDEDAPSKLMQAIRDSNCTSLCCVSDNLASFAWDVAESYGLKIPESLSITGMDDLADPARRGLTSIHFSCEDVGRAAIDIVVNLLQGGDKQPRETIIPVHLIERTSVAPPA